MEKVARVEGKYQVQGFIQLLMLLLQIQLQLRSNANDNQSQFCAVSVGFAIVNAETQKLAALNAKSSQNAVGFFFWHIFAQSGSYFPFFSRDVNVSTKSSSRALFLRFVSPRAHEKYGGVF